MKPVLVISAGTCGLARGAHDLVTAARNYQKEKKLGGAFDVKVTGCHGLCEAEPNVVVLLDSKRIFYQKLKPADIPEIIDQTVVKGKILTKHLVPREKGHGAVDIDEVPFYRKQKRLLLGNNLRIDPTSISDYLKVGGYESLALTLRKYPPARVIGMVKKSGLRGRGGAGFPAGLKWELCRKARSDLKYIICNADEGDPGAYMDRSLLEGNPHAVIEGMIIGAWAIGAAKGIIYVRNEYPLAIKHVDRAIRQARDRGYLGERIMGTRFSFDLEYVRGAGAFVCGEETALMASIEGKAGRPRARPPYPTEKGLWGKPTNINNVETWATVPLIIKNGADWLASIGTAKSKGTKIFSLVGKIRNTGLVEVPMGITLREIIFDIGGGIPGDRPFKAVQTGGPSGGCISKEQLDLQVDYDNLNQAGSIMGSGGMIVMDEDTCMVDVAKYFLNFTQQESCGKCPACRLGTKQMHSILTRITEGRGAPGDVEFLERIGENVRLSSLCGLGQTAPNPALSTIRYFRTEYDLHIKEKKCPALLCKALISFVIDPKACAGCVICAKKCPEGAIKGEPKKAHVIDQSKCIKCGICLSVCPPKFKAVRKVSPAIQ